MFEAIRRYRELRDAHVSRRKSAWHMLPLKLQVMWAVLEGRTVLYNFEMKDGHLVIKGPSLIAGGYIHNGRIFYSRADVGLEEKTN
jgi:hypothetical protein